MTQQRSGPTVHDMAVIRTETIEKTVLFTDGEDNARIIIRGSQATAITVELGNRQAVFSLVKPTKQILGRLSALFAKLRDELP